MLLRVRRQLTTQPQIPMSLRAVLPDDDTQDRGLLLTGPKAVPLTCSALHKFQETDQQGQSAFILQLVYQVSV